jgi:predicted RNA binding protein YcfA (HicA-like mRNA interferase family)
MKLPVLSGKDVIKILERKGFTIKRQKGSHIHLVKTIENKTFHVTVPLHGNKELNPFVLRSIIRQSGLSPSDFSK